MSELNMLEPVQRAQLTDQVIERIKNYIEENNLAAGTRLPGERELAIALGVSRNVTREAVRALQATGILEIQPGNGIFVAEFSLDSLANHFAFVLRRQDDQLQHLVEARILFENGILELASKRLSARDVEILEQATERIAEAKSEAEDIQAELEFHGHLVSVTGNPILMEFSGFFQRFFREAHQLTGRRFGNSDSQRLDAEEHFQIVQALKEKNVRRAQSISESSIRRWRKDEE